MQIALDCADDILLVTKPPTIDNLHYALSHLRDEGLGVLRGKIWRVGLMGINSNEKVVTTALSALELALKLEGYPVKIGEGSRAALEFYGSNR